MADFEELLDECDLLPSDIAPAAKAIAYYAASVSGNVWTKDQSGKWRPTAENFVTIKPQWKQAKSLAVTLRGEPAEFEASSSLDIKKDQNGYSAFRLEVASQIADAFVAIKRAHVLFERGRTRTKTSPKTIG
ncbi:hypothetical protein [Mesorhizobium sp. BE184]|uniref:hypothetical protein n=1 Tax=Mesorhizobium sp. BE184 TaxID=2817714 RepID=UPI002854DD91|nr:hypothetical protein [Mesorhizobium sp. BE184]MDR7033235.1 hypothetical protein [Mesorhizobium sp. BE184]